MKKHTTYILLLMTSITCSIELFGQANKLNLNGEYLGQEKPSLTPKIFAPSIVSTIEEYEFGSVFSSDGNEFYYGVDVGGKTEIRSMIRINDKWTEQKRVNFNGNYSYNDPFLSPDGEKLFFISDMPLNGSGDKKDIDIWYSIRKGEAWSEPINAGNIINSEQNEYYISFTQNGTIYFASNTETTESNRWNFDIYYSEIKNGVYQKPQKLCDSINSGGYESDVFISPDETYIIFCSDRKDGYGQGDLYISFKKDGKWTKAQNMGDKINTKGHELCPFVTNDGNYFFYTSNKDIYWVSTGIFELLRNNSL